jgi:hypothetical protein
MPLIRITPSINLLWKLDIAASPLHGGSFSSPCAIHLTSLS